LKTQLLNWLSRFSSCVFLDNHQYHSPWHQQECLAAAGALHQFSAAAGTNALQQAQQFLDNHRGRWIFGHLGYGLHAETSGTAVHEVSPSATGFADISFFIPHYVVILKPQEVTIHSAADDAERAWQAIQQESLLMAKEPAPFATHLSPRISKKQYLEDVARLRAHIGRGDCYEINYCQEFFAESASIHPVGTYHKLSALSPNPFSAFYRRQHSYLLCASPERFLLKKDNKIYSQPIKGTAPRGQTALDDDFNKVALQASPKERSENVMVVDLVRNDLSRICRPGTVQVDELFGIYTYPQVHQMISTISGVLEEGQSFTDILRATFPMGSMTGAPKHRVLQLINQYEHSPRGLFSGSVGYIAPNGDFDFNVVIRSLQYHAGSGYLSYHVGSGITWYSSPEQEYEECLVKAMAMRKALE
jgi:para-aminobenzoate synthetase component 1